MAFGTRFPKDFNPWRVPIKIEDGKSKITMAVGQHAANPHNVLGKQHMKTGFIAGGPLNTIPDTRALPSVELNLKRCGLCQWVYGRVVHADCQHTVCTVCLGLTALITVDRYICLFCWKVPSFLYIR